MRGRITVLASTLILSFATAAPAGGVASGKAREVAPKQAKVPAQALPSGNPVLGKEKAESERCFECHGENGQGVVQGSNGIENKFAKLAGQLPTYILKQIQDFRSGARKHDQMAIVARNVSDDDVRDIAAYFAALPRMSGQDGDLHQLGKELFEQGDAARGVLACVSCHGDKGKGLASQPLAPLIGGQEWHYLDRQLRDWRASERRNSQDGSMNKVTRELTDKEIEALADYLTGI
ncbi:MAG: c-type cytochrome [Burkholderiales bacterium]|nr:MAG: c-type cytochrome [Burkholderiales bacterium]